MEESNDSQTARSSNVAVKQWSNVVLKSHTIVRQ